MNDSKNNKELANFFEHSFRALKPDRLGNSILALCRDVMESREKAETAELVEMAND